MSADMMASAESPTLVEQQQQPPHPNMEQEAYEPTYAEAFPPLPGGGSTDMGGAGEGPAMTMAAALGGGTGGGSPTVPSEWSSKMSMRMRSSTVTQVNNYELFKIFKPIPFFARS